MYWYENPPLPELAVHGWDYDLTQTAMFFAQKNANAPLHVMFEYLSNTVAVCSDVYGARTLDVVAEVYDFDSRKTWEKRVTVDVPGERSVDAFKIPDRSYHNCLQDDCTPCICQLKSAYY